MVYKNTFFSLVLFFFIIEGFSQGSVCVDYTGNQGAQPFCSISGVEFPNCSNSNADCVLNAETGPNYSCLLTQPFPAWYYMQINNSGDIGLELSQSTLAGGGGRPLDVDFICYGPFTDPTTPCESSLISQNIIDCSFSGDAFETITINNAISGEFYLVLITNFSGEAGFINFAQTSGEGSTDCSILYAALGPDINNCGTEAVVLNADNEEAVAYKWYIFDEFTEVYTIISNETSKELIVTLSGKYQVELKDEEGNTETDEIIITFNTPPVIANAPLDLVLCGDINDRAEFDFLENKNLILGNQSIDDYDVSFYLTEENAEDKNMPLATVYQSNERVIYARIENMALASCYEITSFNLTVNQQPKLSNTAYNYNLCINNDASFDFAILSFDDLYIDLKNGNNEEVSLLDINDESFTDDYSITYHLLESDAFEGLNALPDNSQISNFEVVYVRVENINTGCFNSSNIPAITVIFNQIPLIINSNFSDLYGCSLSTENTNNSFFNLRTYEVEILQGNTSTSEVLYYADINDYNNNLPIESTDLENYYSISSPQTIYAAVYDERSECNFRPFINFDLVVEELPVFPDNFFSSKQKICVDLNGKVKETTLIGRDIIPVDEEYYLYDWTPDNIDADFDGNEDPIFQVHDLLEETTFELVITRVNSVTSGINCSNSINPIEIVLSPTSAPIMLEYEVSENSFSGEYTITAKPSILIGEFEDLEYAIDNGEFQNSPVFNNVNPGEHKLYARNKYGCLPNVVSEIIQIIDYPKFFTPNNDNMNDTWTLYDSSELAASEVYIYDRFGKLLKKISAGDTVGWDGTFNGKTMPSSSYWFLVNYIEPKTGKPNTFKASFALVR